MKLEDVGQVEGRHVGDFVFSYAKTPVAKSDNITESPFQGL